ncbi:universal stress protein [Mycolicibacterium canariasense]|uniref:Universal stress protein n=1 Tax=Mycolicibacterium canariasense TaxID=228230 RepID=A0A100W8N8_MYCCR|nr:universal stress protein [Mycolicibacterium canariasense]MCV7213367.1 universal stress protein [Mycolicibacterium canariasense]ORV10610.1 universal stress protein [Mycolicibacterium canariasense]GAS93591.1 universal stress protein [Mycolicibacterium canariasense]
MSTPAKKYGILVAVDGSPASEAAVTWAARESALRQTPVTLLHVIAPLIVTWPITTAQLEIAEWQDDNSRQVLEQAQKIFHAAAGDADVPPVRTESVPSPVIPTLYEVSKDAMMMVVGNRGTGAHRHLPIGSVGAGLLHHAHCPVVVVRAGVDTDTTAPVLVGVDGSPASEAAIRLAFEEASLRGVDLVAMHAWSDTAVFPAVEMDWHLYEEQAHETLAERLAGWQEQYPDVDVQRRLPCDRPAHWLVTESRTAQMVIVGNRGRGGFSGMLLGSVSSTVAQLSSVPVIVVRE